MKNKIQLHFLVFIFSVIFFSCKSNNQFFNDKYNLTPSKDDSIILRLGSKTKNFSYYLQYFISNNNEYLGLLNGIDKSIEVYDLNNETLFKKFKIPFEGNEAFPDLCSFIINNSFDSVLLFSMLPPRIAVMDTVGHILKKISHTTKTGTLQQGERPIRIGKEIFLVQTYPAHESNGILTATGQKNSYLNITIDLTTGERKTSELKYPEVLIGRPVFIMNVIRELGYRNSFVYHFGSINSFFVTRDHFKFTCIPIESNYKLNLLDDPNMSDSMQKGFSDLLTHDQIICIYFDEYRECYYVVIRKREKILSKNFSSLMYKFTYPYSYILILDKDLKHVGEVHFPDNTYSFRMLFITRKGIYISEDHINNPSFDEDKMKFRLFTLEKVKKPK